MNLLANAITNINLALITKNTYTIIPYSKYIIKILNLLQKENAINNFMIITKKNHLYIKILLKYYQNNTIIKNLKLNSTPNNKKYYSYYILKKKCKLTNIFIISTTKGLITNRDLYLKRIKIGGIIILSFNI